MPSEAFEAIVALMRQTDTLQIPIAERRAALEQSALLIELPDDVAIEQVEVNGVPAEWVRAGAVEPDRVVLYLHGGAYTICSPRTHRRLTAALSRATGWGVLALDYRLAPEHPFPAALEDTVTAYRWLLEGGAHSGHLAIGGDSAGGGLTVASLASMRERGLPLPAATFAISPWVDLELGSESMTAEGRNDPLISRERLAPSAEAYLAGRDPHTPLASPIYADLTGLPPLLIQVAVGERLLDDAKALAQRARSAGVEVSLEVSDEMIHVWHAFAGLFPEADDGVRRIAEFLREKLASVRLDRGAAPPNPRALA